MEKEMKNTTKLLFGIHMHQPIDNFDWVIKHGVEVCYGPFFEVMSKYPQFKFAVHCSGWLMEEIKSKHPKDGVTQQKRATRPAYKTNEKQWDQR